MLKLIIEFDSYKEMLIKLETFVRDAVGNTTVDKVINEEAAKTMTAVPFQGLSQAPEVQISPELGAEIEKAAIQELQDKVIDPIVLPAVTAVAAQAKAVADESDAINYNMKDSRGIAWDRRIHAKNKATNKDGSWRNKRGVDAAVIQRLEGNQSSTGQVVEPKTPEEPKVSAQTNEPIAVSTPQPMPTAAAPIAQPAVVPAAITPPAPVSNVHSFETFKVHFIKIMSGLITDGKITQEWVAEACKYFGVSQLFEVTNSDDHMKELFKTLVDSKLIEQVQQ